MVFLQKFIITFCHKTFIAQKPNFPRPLLQISRLIYSLFFSTVRGIEERQHGRFSVNVAILPPVYKYVYDLRCFVYVHLKWLSRLVRGQRRRQQMRQIKQSRPSTSIRPRPSFYFRFRKIGNKSRQRRKKITHKQPYTLSFPIDSCDVINFASVFAHYVFGYG